LGWAEENRRYSLGERECFGKASIRSPPPALRNLKTVALPKLA